MKLEFEVYKCLCSPKIFRINGIEANYTEFGIKCDQFPNDTPEYGCRSMQFTPYDPIPEVMEKYEIDENEWYEICNALDRLSFGYCNLCA